MSNKSKPKAKFALHQRVAYKIQLKTPKGDLVWIKSIGKVVKARYSRDNKSYIYEINPEHDFIHRGIAETNLSKLNITNRLWIAACYMVGWLGWKLCLRKDRVVGAVKQRLFNAGLVKDSQLDFIASRRLIEPYWLTDSYDEVKEIVYISVGYGGDCKHLIILVLKDKSEVQFTSNEPVDYVGKPLPVYVTGYNQPFDSYVEATKQFIADKGWDVPNSVGKVQ